jgi:hypothetical protein
MDETLSVIFIDWLAKSDAVLMKRDSDAIMAGIV